MRQFEVDRAHVVGFSMGGYSALNFGMEHPEKVLSLVVVGAGHGSDPSTRKQFLEQGTALADNLVKLGLQQVSTLQAASQIGRRHKEKDPRGYEQVGQQFAELSALGCSLTFRGCQLRRPTVYELEAGMKNLTLPTLIATGDNDDMCLEPAFFMKKCIPDARLWIVPRTTHAVNLEESEQFNRVVSDFNCRNRTPAQKWHDDRELIISRRCRLVGLRKASAASGEAEKKQKKQTKKPKQK
jgi:pimeloyl-ACP methyl ester carboxylesterase